MFVSGKSAWRWETSGSAGISVDVFAASGGVLKLTDPNGKQQVFHFGGIGAGLGTPGIKLPKLGNAIGRVLSGRQLNSSGGGTDLKNSGVVLKGGSAAHRELTRSDFTGLCLMADVGISTPIKGWSYGYFLCGVNPSVLPKLLVPETLIFETLVGLEPLTPRAVIPWKGDTRGLVIGGTGYVGYLG